MSEQISAIVETKKGLVFLSLDASEDDDNPVGSLWLVTQKGKGDEANEILTTNETLTALWASPKGNLWVGCADGRVATTADFDWDAPSRKADYKAHNGGPEWTVSTLPKETLEKLPPNVSVIWGSADDDVHVGTNGGHLYHWNGKKWAQTHEGDGSEEQTIQDIKGHGSDSVFAIGTRDHILHFDGKKWKSLATPGAPNEDESMGGIAILPDKSVLICTASADEGRLLQGNAKGFKELGQYPHPLYNMATIGKRMLFAIGEGVAELSGKKMEVVKSTFQTYDAFEGAGKIFFTEPEDGLQFIVHDPKKKESAWQRRTY